MITKLLGILDILSALSFTLLKFNVGKSIAWFFVIYVVIKAFIFIKDFASLVDLIAVIFFILAIFNIFPAISWVFVFWLTQKGFFSLLG